MDELKKYIRSIEDFPKEGVTFYDLSTLILDPNGLRLALDLMEDFVVSCEPNKLLGIESRGFVFGAALADRLNLGLTLARKPGKLPGMTIGQEYQLEYGTDRIEIHSDAIQAGDRVVIVDDLVATGGTLEASAKLVEKVGGKVAGLSLVVGLPFLPYESKISHYRYNCLITYDSE